VGEVRAVLDASALISLLLAEPGAGEVYALGDAAAISTVNWTEVLEVTAALGLSTAGRREQVERLGVTLIPFTPEYAEVAAALRPETRRAGLSLADRACLALALALGATAVTADRAWGKVDVGVDVKLIR
jgi:ribonuclease VapC